MHEAQNLRLFARHAVQAAMAGKTGLLIGFLHERFIHVPIELLARHTKRLDPASRWWRSVLAATGQRDNSINSHPENDGAFAIAEENRIGESREESRQG